ncbi:MAG TPA: hypothetical protein VK186_16215 [Candidatus Deferrimicrobium sp.]|nr:hypothetical protein [Candidatus Kapabacteria bacterium]HLP60386.1 hypothetical protein [Candidatus Deferrimicrobium sp.]
MEEKIVQLEIFHKDYNLDKKDNLETLPEGEAVFGIFAIIHEKPVHCRYIGQTATLRKTIKDLFEHPGDEGFAKFMQGPWIQMLVYELMPGSSEEDRKKAAEDWTKKHTPKCDEKGEYPR